MAMSNVKAQCFSCRKETRTFNCGGCVKDFCLNCLTKHIQTLGQELDKIENDHDQFRQALYDQRQDIKKHLLIKKIDQWEKDAISKIKKTAEQCRERLINYTDKFIVELENQLNNLAREIKQIREDNEFNEIDLNKFKEKLNQLREELGKPTNVLVEQQSSLFINKISVILRLNKDTKWKQNGITIAGGNGDGNQLNQLSFPYGICIDDHQTIYIADFGNDRVVEWKCNATKGQIVAGKNDEGNQLSQPTDVTIDQEKNSLIITAYGNRQVMCCSCQHNTNVEIMISGVDCHGLTMDENGSLYVCDFQKHEVRRWRRGEKGKGTIVAGGNGQGDQLNQLSGPNYIFVDDDHSLYVSEWYNHRVMKWVQDTNEGIVVAGGNGRGNKLNQLSHPTEMIVEQSGHIYVADFDNHRVMRWCKGAKEGTIVVGGNGGGQQANQLNCPIGLSADRYGNLYIVDHNNHRIQKFEVE